MFFTSEQLKLGLMVLLLLGLVAYGAVLTWMYLRQEAILFRPTRLHPDYQFVLPDVTEVKVPVPDGYLSAVHFRQPASNGVVFFLHGNVGDLSTWLTNTTFYQQVGFDVFMIDYRGYGKSPGRIESEAQLHADVRAAWEWLEPQYSGRKKVIYGRSLGSALAAHLAASVDCDSLVLVTPFASIVQVTEQIYPWVPLRLLRYPLRTDHSVPKVKAPLLILHGDQDELFSLSHAQKLRDLHAQSQLVEIKGAKHGDIHEFKMYSAALAQWLKQL